MGFRVFLSHSSKDEELVSEIKNSLHMLDCDVYLAIHDPRPGQYLSEKIQQEIRSCDIFIVLITQHSINSRYVQQEIGVALGEKKTIVPIVLRGVEKEQLAMLEGKEYILFDPQDPEQMKLNLSRFLSKMKERELALDLSDLVLGLILGTILGVIIASFTSKK